MIDVKACPGFVVPLGRVGENNSRRIVFDVSWLSDFPGADLILYNRRVMDEDAYPVFPDQMEIIDGKLYWTVTSADVAAEGSGKCQVAAYLNGAIVKSEIYHTVCLAALDKNQEPPAPWVSWQRQLVSLAHDAEEAANAASQYEQAAETAKKAAETAGESATEDAGRAEESAQNAGLDADRAEQAKTAAQAAQEAAEAAEASVDTKAVTVIQAIETTGGQQVAAVEQKGEQVRQSIPSDYTELSEDVTGLKRAISELDGVVYYQTDNLLDFVTDGFWVRKDFSGSVNVYSLTTANKIPVTGGSELYTALKGLSTDTLGNQFVIRVRQFDANDTQVGSDMTFSSIISTNPIHYTLNASTAKILITLTTNNYNKQITPAMFQEMNPLIYAGFNNNITNETVYRKFEPVTDQLFDEVQSAKSIIGTTFLGFIPSNISYPRIDTTAKTFTLYEATDLIDRRLPNGVKSVTSRIVYDYSSISAQTSAIMFVWDIANSTIIAVKAANANTIDQAKYIPICMFRANRTFVYSSTPIYVDGLLYGVVNLDDVNYGSIWHNDNVRGINHRGYSTAPENTIPAFKLSKDNGFDSVETDVRFTSDGVAVLLHDESINRTARNSDGTTISTTINIADITYEQALEYDFGIYKGTAYAGTKIPRFDQFLIVCRRLGLHPYVEIKTGTQGQIEGLADTAVLCGMKKSTTWISYNASQLGYIKGKIRSARLGLIASSGYESLITTAVGLKTSDNEVFVDLDNYAPVTSSFINDLIAADLPLEVYVNGDWSIGTSNAYITGITTDTGSPSRYLYQLYNRNV